MKALQIFFNDQTLSMRGPKHAERLTIASCYPWDSFSESLFAQFGLMHLVAPYLPRTIKSNFSIAQPMQKLIGAMYKSGGQLRPEFQTPRLNGQNLKPKRSAKANRVAIAYSAGKDSMWNLWWATEKYGVDNILVVHIKNLNRNNGPGEVKHVLNQQKKLGFKHLEIIELHNGSLNTGYQVMRSRDMFLAGLIIPIVLRFGASQIITEGFDGAKPNEPFTGLETNMIYFNEVLKELEIPVQVAWRNRDEMLTIKDLFNNRPEWMPHVCNCFTITCYQGYHRRTFQKSMPTFHLYDSQCGVCIKCRITNVARVLYDPSMANTRSEDIITFLKKTDAWIRTKERQHNLSDMIEGPFMRDFVLACEKYSVVPRSVSAVR